MNRLAILDCDGQGWGFHDGPELISAGAAAAANRPLDVLILVREHADG